MLKVCWDCLFGNGGQSETEGPPTVNGYPLSSISHRQNEMAFKIPRPLQNEDTIEIKGQMKTDRERICIGLTTEQYNSIDYNNIVCEVEARFNEEDAMVLRTVVNGHTNETVLERERPSDFLPVAEFTFRFRIVEDYANKIEIYIGESYLDNIELKHNLRDISYVTLSYDILKVNELCFKFN